MSAVPEPLPPGEVASDELLGGAALAALDDALQAITKAPRVRLTLADIDVRKTGRWTVLKVKYRGKGPENEVTVRMSNAWAKVLTQRLRRVHGL